MNHIPAEDLALYASGDMETKKLLWVEEHLRKCNWCRESLAEFQRDLTALQALWADPEAEELAALRQGVIERLQKKGKFALPWTWAAASITAAAMGAAGMMLIHPQHQRATKTYQRSAMAYLQVPYGSLAEFTIPNLNTKVVRSRRVPSSEPAGIRGVTLLAEQDGPRTLRMTTADPNVVILWQLNERTPRP